MQFNILFSFRLYLPLLLNSFKKSKCFKFWGSLFFLNIYWFIIDHNNLSEESYCIYTYNNLINNIQVVNPFTKSS